jgi:hypothetical protein
MDAIVHPYPATTVMSRKLSSKMFLLVPPLATVDTPKGKNPVMGLEISLTKVSLNKPPSIGVPILKKSGDRLLISPVSKCVVVTGKLKVTVYISITTAIHAVRSAIRSAVILQQCRILGNLLIQQNNKKYIRPDVKNC